MWKRSVSDTDQAMNLTTRKNLTSDPSTYVTWNNPPHGQSIWHTRQQNSLSAWSADPPSTYHNTRYIEDDFMNTYRCFEGQNGFSSTAFGHLSPIHRSQLHQTSHGLPRPIPFHPTTRSPPYCLNNNTCSVDTDCIKMLDTIPWIQMASGDKMIHEFESTEYDGGESDSKSILTPANLEVRRSMTAMDPKLHSECNYSTNMFLDVFTPDSSDVIQEGPSFFEDCVQEMCKCGTLGLDSVHDESIRRLLGNFSSNDILDGSTFTNNKMGHLSSPQSQDGSLPCSQQYLDDYKELFSTAMSENSFIYKDRDYVCKFNDNRKTMQENGFSEHNGPTSFTDYNCNTTRQKRVDQHASDGNAMKTVSSIYKPKLHLIKKFENSSQRLTEGSTNDKIVECWPVNNRNHIYSMNSVASNKMENGIIRTFHTGNFKTESEIVYPYKVMCNKCSFVMDLNNNQIHSGIDEFNVNKLNQVRNEGQCDKNVENNAESTTPSKSQESIMTSPEDLNPCESFFWCHVCEKSIKREDKSIAHQLTHSKAPKVNLNSYFLQVYGSVTKHWKGYTSDGKCVYICGLCDGTIPYSNGFRQHIRVHGNGSRHETLLNLDRHRNPGNDNRNCPGVFSCVYCDKQFNTKCGLKMHTKSHTFCRVFSCQYCGKRLSSKGSLKIHTRLHTGHYPYKCTLCKKGYPQNIQLKLHIKSHKRRGEI